MARRKTVAGEESPPDDQSPVIGQEAAGESQIAAAVLNGEDPAQRLADIARRFSEAETVYDGLKVERDALVFELAQAGWTEQRLAWMLRVSQVRVHQLIKEQRARS